MPVVCWKEDVEGAARASHPSISSATRFLDEKGIKLHDTQMHREAKRIGCRNGWRFSFDPILRRTSMPSPLHHNRSLACWVLPGKYAAAVMSNAVVI